MVIFLNSIDKVRSLSTAVNKAEQLGVQFIDPVEIISCDTHGCDYYNPRHDVQLRIPEEAILPSEGSIDIEFGVAMYGPFELTDGRSVSLSSCVALCSARRLQWISERHKNYYSTLS